MRTLARLWLVVPAVLALATNAFFASSIELVVEFAQPLTISEASSLHGEFDDSCGVCGGTNTRCAGCDGVPNSGRVADVCGLCGGSGSTCAQMCNVRFVTTTLSWAQDIIWSVDDGGPDADGPSSDPVSFGTGAHAFEDNTVYTFDFTLQEGRHALHFSDAFGDGWDGATVEVFETGQSETDPLLSLTSTFAQPAGSAAFDVVCGGVRGCDGVPGSAAAMDACGVCGGNGTSCDVTGMRCSEAAYSVRLSEQPALPTIVTVVVQPCSPASLCALELFRDGSPDFSWQRELYFDQASWALPQTVRLRSVQVCVACVCVCACASVCVCVRERERERERELCCSCRPPV
eukprot:SAG22_NODE_1557_length_4130_cov_12.560159_3_plen_346_part_00